MTRLIRPRRAWILVATLGVSCAFGQTWEQQSGEAAAAAIAESVGLIEGDVADYVASVGALLVERGQPEGGPYRFHVADMPEPNAFALPGGHIYIASGLLPLLDNEAELAGVLAHEIGHTAANHHLESRRRRAPFLPVKLATAISATAVGLVSDQLGDAVDALGNAPGDLLLASFGRQQETEADEIGQRLAAASGWSPHGIAQVMHTLGREKALMGADPNRLSFFASHPTSPERERITRERAESLPAAPGSGLAVGRRAFFERLDGLRIGPSGAEGLFVGERFLHADLDFTFALPTGWRGVNRATSVSGAPLDGSAAVLLTLAPGQTDAETAARVAQETLGETPIEGPDLVRINGLRAVRTVVPRSDTRVLVYWIEHRDLVFRWVGILSTPAFEERRSELERVARSFRPLTEDERDQVREARVRIFDLEAGDTVESLLSRLDSPWTPEQVAIANGLRADEPLARPRPIKLPVFERYEPERS